MVARELARPPASWPLTRRAGPAEARIRRDLEAITEIAREDPHLDALLLTGGFSRGEGTVRAGRPVNDYDLVAVRRRPGASAVAPRVEALGEGMGLHVDYLEVWRPRLAFVGPKLFWFDLRHGGRVLHGDPRVLESVPAFRAHDLPAEEGLRLLANRAAGLLLAAGGPSTLVDVQAAKALLAAADARLVAVGLYAPTTTGRLERFRDLAGRDAEAAEALAWVERAAAFKLDPDADPLPAVEAWDAARLHLLAALPSVACASRAGSLERWLERGTAAEAAWYARASRGRGLRRLVRRPTARARRLAIGLLRDIDRVDPGVRRDLAAFGVRAGDWEAARRAALEIRACTLQ